MNDKPPKNTLLHLSWQELLALANKISNQASEKKAKEHCALCIICEQRLANLKAYLESQGGQKAKGEKDSFLEPWMNAASFLQEIETAREEEKKGVILIFPAVFVAGESMGKKSRACGAENGKAVLDRPMRLEVASDKISATLLQLLTRLRFMFSQDGDSLYLEFGEIPLQALTRIIEKVLIGTYEYSREEIDEQGGIYLGKIASSSDPGGTERFLHLEDLEKIRIVVNCHSVY